MVSSRQTTSQRVGEDAYAYIGRYVIKPLVMWSRSSLLSEQNSLNKILESCDNGVYHSGLLVFRTLSIVRYCKEHKVSETGSV
jgi:hypothetical protein